MAFFNLPDKRFNNIYLDGTFTPNITIRAKTKDDVISNFPKNSSIEDYYNHGTKLLMVNGKLNLFYDSSHYIYDDNSENWKYISTLPYSIKNSTVLVFNSVLHFYNGIKHWLFNNNQWILIEQDLPAQIYNGEGIQLDDRYYIVYGKKLYGTYGYSFTLTRDLPEYFIPDFSKGRLVIYCDSIHLFGSDGSTGTNGKSKCHYKWDPVKGFCKVSDLPLFFINDSALVINDKLHLFIGNGNTTTYHYVFEDDTSTWTFIGDINGTKISGGDSILYKENLVLLGHSSISGVNGGKAIKTLYEVEITSNYLEPEEV